jgi:hypothetical protein
VQDLAAASEMDFNADPSAWHDRPRPGLSEKKFEPHVCLDWPTWRYESQDRKGCEDRGTHEPFARPTEKLFWDVPGDTGHIIMGGQKACAARTSTASRAGLDNDGPYYEIAMASTMFESLDKSITNSFTKRTLVMDDDTDASGAKKTEDIISYTVAWQDLKGTPKVQPLVWMRNVLKGAFYPFGHDKIGVLPVGFDKKPWHCENCDAGDGTCIGTAGASDCYTEHRTAYTTSCCNCNWHAGPFSPCVGCGDVEQQRQSTCWQYRFACPDGGTECTESPHHVVYCPLEWQVPGAACCSSVHGGYDSNFGGCSTNSKPHQYQHCVNFDSCTYEWHVQFRKDVCDHFGSCVGY